MLERSLPVAGEAAAAAAAGSEAEAEALAEKWWRWLPGVRGRLSWGSRVSAWSRCGCSDRFSPSAPSLGGELQTPSDSAGTPRCGRVLLAAGAGRGG